MEEKFFNETILNHSKAIAFLLEEGDTEVFATIQYKRIRRVFDDYEQALNWLNEYQYKN